MGPLESLSFPLRPAGAHEGAISQFDGYQRLPGPPVGAPGGHRARPRRRALAAAADPVSGVIIQESAAAGSAAHADATYYFCSTNCQERSEADPGQYDRGDRRPHDGVAAGGHRGGRGGGTPGPAAGMTGPTRLPPAT